MFKNVMVALGLGPDEEYDDRYFEDGELDLDELDRHNERPVAPGRAIGMPDEPVAGLAGAGVVGSGVVGGQGSTGTVGAVRPIRPVAADDDPSFTVRPISRGDSDELAVVTPVVASKPRTVAPQSFGDAKVIADEFKRSTPVVMQLSDVERELARRLIDFASGVCYSLGGSMEKLAANVFLLLPKGTEVSADERRRIEERGYDR